MATYLANQLPESLIEEDENQESGSDTNISPPQPPTSPAEDVRTCMYVCTYVCMYIICMYVCTYVCMYVYNMYVCMYVRMYVHTYVVSLARIPPSLSPHQTVLWVLDMQLISVSLSC